MSKCLCKKQIKDAVGIRICMDCGEVIIPNKFEEPKQALKQKGTE